MKKLFSAEILKDSVELGAILVKFEWFSENYCKAITVF